MNLVIKKFDDLNTKELYEIIRERINVFVVEQNCPYEECDKKDLKSFHLFLEEKDTIVAYLRIIPKGVSYNEVSIGRVLVSKEHRNKGLAKYLLNEAIKFIKKELKESEIRISAQEYIMKFYEDLGFVKVSQIYLEDNIPHVEMVYGKQS